MSVPHLRPDGGVVRGLLDELVHRYSTSVPPEMIDRIFQECLAQFSTARIGDFVPVLAQRCAKAKLEVLKSAGATPRAGGNGFASVSELEIAEDDPARPLSPSQGPEGGDCSCSGRGPRSGYR